MAKIWKAVLIAVGCISGVALAQQTPTTTDQPGTGGAEDQSYVSRGVLSHPTPENIWEANPMTLRVQGGVEGYGGALASRIDPGPGYGLALGYEPMSFLGFELGYSGAVNELKDQSFGTSGPDLVRNGGYAIVTPGLGIPLGRNAGIKPYVLGGIGADWYTPSANSKGAGFSTQTQGNVPFGAGLEVRAGKVVADARFNYAYQFGTSFSNVDSNPLRYLGQLSVGASF